jgi:hypothetical protein
MQGPVAGREFLPAGMPRAHMYALVSSACPDSRA